MVRRVLCAVLMLSVAISCTTFAGASMEEVTPIVEGERVLELEYMDFYNNQDYYMRLVEEEDYTLHFYVDEEYRELEAARQAESVSCTDELKPVMTRGTTPPTQEHRIFTGNLSFEGKSSYSNLYTNYYCTGSPWYNVTINNYRQGNQMLTVKAYNVVSSQTTTAFRAGTTIKKYTMAGIGNVPVQGHFYLCFYAPVDVSGTIAKAN